MGVVDPFPSVMRCFISIELPRELKKEMDAATASLRASNADIKWVSPENLHLTLKFLGDTPEELLPRIKEELASALREKARFRVRLSGIGVFPDRRRPRVIWIGMQDSDNLLLIQKSVDDAMAKLGYESEGRPFRAHLTLGRIRSQRGLDAVLRVFDVLKDMVFGDMEVEAVSVMKSELSPKGSKYSELFDIPLMTASRPLG